jgi:hypothetical protein
VLRLLYGLPMLLCDPGLHRPREGTMEAVDCFELMDSGLAE